MNQPCSSNKGFKHSNLLLELTASANSLANDTSQTNLISLNIAVHNSCNGRGREMLNIGPFICRVVNKS